MLGFGRSGLRKIANRRGFSAAVQASSSSNSAQNNIDVRQIENRGRNRPFVSSTPIEQVKLQKKFQENLKNNKLESIHDAIEYIEWRGTVYSQTLTKIVNLIEDNSEISNLSDRQIAVLISAFGSIGDTLGRSERSRFLEKAENLLKSKGVKLGTQSRNALMQCKLENQMKIDVVEELQIFENDGLELDAKSYALICEAYAKTGNTKAITDIFSYMKSNGIGLAEDHVAQLVYSLARSGNDGQVSKVVEAFSNTMNVVRLRCVAAQAIIERERNEAGKGVFELTEMLRRIPTTAKIHTIDNNVHVLNVFMDLVESGQTDAFQFLSSYMMLADEGTYLANNSLNIMVVARAKSFIEEGKILEAISLYSVVNPEFSNEYFVRQLNQKLEEKLKGVTNETFDDFLKVLTFAANKGIISNANEFLLSACASSTIPAFLKIFEVVKSSGEMRQILMRNSGLKSPIARQLGHALIKTASPTEQAKLLADVGSVVFVPTRDEEIGKTEFYPIVYKLSGKDVKLAMNALDHIPEKQEKREFATAFAHQLLRSINDDHVAIDKLSTFLESNKIEQVSASKLHNMLIKMVANDMKDAIPISAKLLALDFPPEDSRSIVKVGARNLVRFMANEMISEEKAEKIIKILESEARATLKPEELNEAKEMLKASPKKAELIGRLKKSQTMTRWRASSVEELLNELKKFKADTKIEIVNALRDVILHKTLAGKTNDLGFLVEMMELASEWRKEAVESGKTLPKSIRENSSALEMQALSKALVSNDMVLADRIWSMRSTHLSADVSLAYASKLFINNQTERADEVCEDLRVSSQQIRPATLEKTGRKLKGVDMEKMDELAAYLSKQFNLRPKETRRIVMQVKLDQLENLIRSDKLDEALRMAVEETKTSGRAFGQVPIMIEAIKKNNTKILESIHGMVKNAHNQDMANVNLVFALICAGHVGKAKQLAEKQNLEVEDHTLAYFNTLAVASGNVDTLKNMFIAFNGRASTVQLNNLLETVTRLMWKKGDIDGLNELSREIESTSFPLQMRLRKFFDDLKNKYSNVEDEI